MTESQLSICTWADATFGPASDASIAARALVEMAELVTACVYGRPAEEIGEEIADVVIVLARLGRSLGVDASVWLNGTRRSTVYRCALDAAAGLASVALAIEPGRDNKSWAAVCLQTLLHDLADLATHFDCDLSAAIDRKMAINRARKWHVDGNGHGSHIKGAP